METLKCNRSKTRLLPLLAVFALAASCFDGLGGLADKPFMTPAPHTPSVMFTSDTDRDEDQICGVLSITEPDQNDEIKKYRIYWSNSSGNNFGLICELARGATVPDYTLIMNSAVPSGATHFAAYSISTDDKVSAPALLDIEDGVLKKVSEVNINHDASPQSDLTHMTVYNNKLYFNAGYGTANGVELWSYDGTGDPVEVYNISPSGSSSPASLGVYNGKLYFSADGGTNGNELWSYDGINPPVEIDIVTGSTSSNPAYMKAFNGKLYFQANGNNGHGTELWTYDGINPPSEFPLEIRPTISSSYPSYFAELNGELYFQGTRNNGAELWKWDGDINHNAVQVGDKYVSLFTSSYPSYLCAYNGRIYFSATTADGNEL